MKAYLVLRCRICPNQSFRSVNSAEAHMISEHGGMIAVDAEWVGLPANIYKGGLVL